MPTKIISKVLLGVLSASLFAAPAFAGGNCNGGSCSTGVQVLPSYAPDFGPMTIRTEQPLGHLRSVNFQRAPNVSITRVHGLGPTASLSDAPSGFTGGCHPTSTTYCRQNAGQAVQIQPAFPVAAPVFQAPVFQAPVIQAPAAPVIVRTGGGYDPSKFTPRVYGDASLVPGVAYLPTSRVVRDPAAAQQVLDSGQTRPQDVVVPGTGTAPHLGMIAGASTQQQIRHIGFVQPQRGFVQASAPNFQPTGANYSPVANDGTYWEKVSGPTRFGNTVATSVICKRQVQQRVINPVIGVPVAVPVPVPAGCQNVRAQAGRYNQGAAGRWIQ